MLYLVCLELNTRERERDMKNVFRKNKQASRSAAMASHCNHVLPQRSLANQNHLSQHDLSHMLYNYIIICCLSLSLSLCGSVSQRSMATHQVCGINLVVLAYVYMLVLGGPLTCQG